MSKRTALKIVNVVLAALVVNQAASGFLHGRLSHQTFERLHEGGAYLLIICIVAHVALNWAWIRATYLSGK